jgi:hypothetical protein
MRTTVNIADEALELCRRTARQKGVSLGEAISEAILEAYRPRPAEWRRDRFELPVSGQCGLKPGVDLDSSVALEDLLEGRA